MHLVVLAFIGVQSYKHTIYSLHAGGWMVKKDRNS